MINEKIEYVLIRKKIKNVYIGIKDGQVVVRAPMRLSTNKIEELLNSKKDWIENKLNSKKEDRNINLKNKNYIYVLNKKIDIEYVKKDLRKIQVFINEETCKVVVPNDIVFTQEVYEKIERKIDNELKEIAKKYIIEAMDKYIRITNLKPNKVSIRKFKSIWGNCSSRGEIKINQNIIFYGKEQIEYVCLHEITHLKYMNHQKEFWNFICKYMPNYKEISKALKQ
jgi:hypothetical protein